MPYNIFFKKGHPKQISEDRKANDKILSAVNIALNNRAFRFVHYFRAQFKKKPQKGKSPNIFVHLGNPP